LSYAGSADTRTPVPGRTGDPSLAVAGIRVAH